MDIKSTVHLMTKPDSSLKAMVDVYKRQVLCLVINAKLISQYGIHGYLNKSEKQNKPRYINTPHKHNRKSCTYEYGGKQIRIK